MTSSHLASLFHLSPPSITLTCLSPFPSVLYSTCLLYLQVLPPCLTFPTSITLSCLLYFHNSLCSPFPYVTLLDFFPLETSPFNTCLPDLLGPSYTCCPLGLIVLHPPLPLPSPRCCGSVSIAHQVSPPPQGPPGVVNASADLLMIVLPPWCCVYLGIWFPRVSMFLGGREVVRRVVCGVLPSTIRWW